MNSTFLLAIRLESGRGERTVTVRDEHARCPHCKRLRRRDTSENHWLRSTRLYTLSQQIREILVEDWLCSFCFKKVLFTGEGVAVYPVRKTFCFTYELLYHFVHNVCCLGISFRAQYDSYHMVQVAQSTKARYDSFLFNSTESALVLEVVRQGDDGALKRFDNFFNA